MSFRKTLEIPTINKLKIVFIQFFIHSRNQMRNMQCYNVELCMILSFGDFVA